MNRCGDAPPGFGYRQRQRRRFPAWSRACNPNAAQTKCTRARCLAWEMHVAPLRAVPAKAGLGHTVPPAEGFSPACVIVRYCPASLVGCRVLDPKPLARTEQNTEVVVDRELSARRYHRTLCFSLYLGRNSSMKKTRALSISHLALMLVAFVAFGLVIRGYRQEQANHKLTNAIKANDNNGALSALGQLPPPKGGTACPPLEASAAR
jgi:hypothetical protein